MKNNKRKLTKKLLYKFWITILIVLFIICFVIMIKSNLYFSVSFLILIYLINSILIIGLFYQNRNIESKLSWMMILFILPFIGHIIYLLYGQKYSGSKKKEDYDKEYSQKYINTNNSENINLIKKQDLYLTSFENLSKQKFKNVDFNIFEESYMFFDKLFDSIKKAKKTIYIETYIIKRGEIWFELKNLLIQKSQENVEIKIIVDGFGILDLPAEDFKELQKYGIQIIVYNKLKYPILNFDSWYRIHKKITIIDNKIAFLGGNNISDEYASYSSKYGLWNDSNFFAEGEIVTDYSLSFARDWNTFSKKYHENIDVNKIKKQKVDAKIQKTIGLIIEDSPELEETLLEDFLIKLILNAKKNIILSTPYFVPTFKILNSLKIAILSGVKVTIIVPGIYDKKIVKFASKYFLNELHLMQAQIYFVNDVFVHSKMGVFDDEYAYLGSMNIDTRSLYAQNEIITLFKGKAVKEINKNFQKMIKYSSNWNDFYQKDKKFQKINILLIKIFKTLL